MKKPISVCLFFVTVCSYGVDPGYVINVARDLRMHNSDPLPEKQYTLSVGALDGVAPGNVLKVIRRAPAYDRPLGIVAELVPKPLAELKVVAVGLKNCLATEVAPVTRSYGRIAVGDEVLLAATVSNPIAKPAGAP